MDDKELKTIERRKNETMNDMGYYALEMEKLLNELKVNPCCAFDDIITDLATRNNVGGLLKYLNLRTQYDYVNGQHETYVDIYEKAYGIHEAYLDKD